MAAELDADEAEQRRQLTQAVDEDHTSALNTIHRDLNKEVSVELETYETLFIRLSSLLMVPTSVLCQQLCLSFLAFVCSLFICLSYSNSFNSVFWCASAHCSYVSLMPTALTQFSGVLLLIVHMSYANIFISVFWHSSAHLWLSVCPSLSLSLSVSSSPSLPFTSFLGHPSLTLPSLLLILSPPLLCPSTLPPIHPILFFFVLGSHLPMNRKLLGDFAALLGGLQSPIKWYSEKIYLFSYKVYDPDVACLLFSGPPSLGFL